MAEPTAEEQTPPTPPSKSARKREMHELQALGTRLTQLPIGQLEQVPFSDPRLREAIYEARAMKQRGALRRQLQFIGKLMRGIDPIPIQNALAKFDRTHQASQARFHRLEQLRDQLLSQGDAALDTLLAAYPSADRQHLRQLRRQYDPHGPRAKEQARKIFRYLRELDDAVESEVSWVSPSDGAS